ncbi:hypothetical protein ACFSHQ_12900 [Gemmobacter lanyuensis]
MVVVDVPVPVGKPDLGPENHVFLAPDAPGKDRMEPPPPTPGVARWGRQPAGTGEMALSGRGAGSPHARCDRYPCPRAEGAPSAFDLCETARHGVVMLVGHRIYPWRVRPGREAAFGDHVCRQFDGRRGIARWGVAPGKAGLENSWRMARVAYVKPDEDGVVPFLRAMAIRVPGRSSGELAPNHR